MRYNIELIRLLAVLLITFTHTRHEFAEGTAHFILEELPTYGTLILSLISDYLYWIITREKSDLVRKKIRSLLIPFLIANASVLLLVVIAYYGFGFNYLNRLSFDYHLLTEGLLSLNTEPINPPTYFIRDIFVVFCLVDLFLNRNLKMLLFLVPLYFFGSVLIRIDILFLFIVGCALGHVGPKVHKGYLATASVALLLVAFLLAGAYVKHALAILLFILIYDLKINFVDAGGYSYLLHLYHSPVMVVSYPLILMVTVNPYIAVVAQILLALGAAYALYRLTRKYPRLKVMSGGR